LVDWLGDTLRVPEVDTPPIPLSILTPVAFEVVHESVLEPPCWIEVGLAESVQVGGGVTRSVTVVTQVA